MPQTANRKPQTANCVLMLGLLASCSDAVDGVQTEHNSSATTSIQESPAAGGSEFRHPLFGVELINGKVPGVDIHVDPMTGQALAVGEVTTQIGTESPKTRSGILRLERTFSPPSNFDELGEMPNALRLLRPKLRGELEQQLQHLDEDQRIAVRIRVRDSQQLEHFNQEMDRAIGLGLVRSEADYQIQRRAILDGRKSHKILERKSLSEHLTASGVEFVERKYTNFITAWMSKSQIVEASKHPDVHSISVNTSSSDDQAYCPIIPSSWLGTYLDGVEVSHGAQMQQFLCDGHDGSQVYAGVIEKGVTIRNWGRYTAPSNSGDRLMERRGCGLFYCNTADSGDQTIHASQTTGLLFGDLRAGQDANVTDDVFRLTYSGYSPKLKVYSYALEEGPFSFEVAVDEAIGEPNHLDLINVSWGISPSDTVFHDCHGDWDEDEAVNELYESGTLVFKSAGNEGHKGHTNNCTISIPGAAVGAFTVGGIGNRFSGTDIVDDVINGPIYTWSSGGSESDGRILVDLLAPAYRRNLMTYGGTYSTTAAGTSFSTPTVAAAAANFIDFYVSHYSSWIRSPGALHSQMLLMGDRQSYNGRLNVGYEEDWGAGRMHMRKFDSTGMDSPWGYGRYSVCVNKWEYVTYNLGTLPAGVDRIKAVAYWYDRRHDSGEDLDNVELIIQAGDVSVASTNMSTEKQRVSMDLSASGATDVQIKLYGVDVDADNEGCGTNSNRVYVGWYYEDTTRNDADGPGAEIKPF